MDTTSFRIMLQSPQIQQIQLDSGMLHSIGITTPVAYGTAKLTLDTSENWANKLSYVPARGEIIIYSNRNVVEGIDYPGIKIGDGSAYVVDLPFVNDDMFNMITNVIACHINDTNVHVTTSEKIRWNNKLDYNINGETLVFERTEVNG